MPDASARSESLSAGDTNDRPVLITGGAGFIGSNLADHFLSAGSCVVILDNSSRRGSEENARWLADRDFARLRILRAEIRDAGPWQDSVREAALVFHWAAQVAVASSVANPRTDFEINAAGTLNAVEAARAARRPPGHCLQLEQQGLR